MTFADKYFDKVTTLRNSEVFMIIKEFVLKIVNITKHHDDIW